MFQRRVLPADTFAGVHAVATHSQMHDPTCGSQLLGKDIAIYIEVIEKHIYARKSVGNPSLCCRTHRTDLRLVQTRHQIQTAPGRPSSSFFIVTKNLSRNLCLNSGWLEELQLLKADACSACCSQCTCIRGEGLFLLNGHALVANRQRASKASII